jgi:2-(1,2-epoxy-1,2-dihydrophenyl)acetyl-CoA isomerase
VPPDRCKAWSYRELSDYSFEVADGIARLTLNRPERLNSFNTTMHAEGASGARKSPRRRERWDEGASPGSQRLGSWFLRRTGPRRSRRCARGAAVDLGESIEKNYKPLVMALRNLPMPVIGAVNGVAAGAGANIALACDLVVATRSASFVQGFSEAGIGARLRRDLDPAAVGGNGAGAGARLSRR